MLADPLRSTQPSLLSTTRGATVVDPLGLFAEAHAQQQDRALWLRPSSGEAFVGIGAAHELAAGASEEWSMLLDDASIDDPAGLLWTGPLLLGGFRFDPAREPTQLWSEFETDRLVLPERIYVQRGASAWLTTNQVHGVVDARAPLRTLQPAERGLAPLAWQSLVAEVSEGIRDQQLGLQKVVLARTESVSVAQAFDPVDVLRRLARTYPTCTVFAIGRGDATFVGATPERLVNVCAGLATTMALAGSFARGRTEDEDRALGQALLEDPKERAEHAFVVEALRSGLQEVSTRVVADAEPRLRKLANVQHLLTPVHGRLAPGRSILDVAQRLHPTPAVGGVPTAAALALIRDREQLDRGWYGGPVGWLNRSGEGEFVVGIRSALLRGNEATLFAGCGIVADSIPSAELAESNWKLRPMLSALGISE